MVGIMASNEKQPEFSIDKQEYQSVFKVFDKDNSGQIHVEQVNNYISRFEQIQINSTDMGSPTK